MSLLKKILKWTVIVLVGLFVLAELLRWPYRLRNERTTEQVQIIHNTKLELVDVMGENLPPDPGIAADDTIVGIDANENGIRDDVELAIFAKYPNSAKTRGPLLQYALVLQMIFNQPIISEGTVTKVITELDRADVCISDTLVPRKTPESSRTTEEVRKINVFIDFVDNLQINTKEREKYNDEFYNKLRSYGDSENEVCDIDYSTLVN